MSSDRLDRAFDHPIPANGLKYIRKQWFPVRCCCTPQKIFGFLQVNRDAVDRCCQTIMLDRDGQEHVIEIRRISAGTCEADRELTIHEELAVYSDDRPIEFWRTIPDFMEAV